MEKCTFCIQRIRAARDKAKDGFRTVRSGEVTTACAQSCPTGAITFGNLLDPESRVYLLAHSGRAYRVFEGLGTDPSVYYLSGEKGGPEGEGHG
jgi:molybdopterin-containing oxidoreductase family iron-sulfur binding subunit